MSDISQLGGQKENLTAIINLEHQLNNNPDMNNPVAWVLFGNKNFSESLYIQAKKSYEISLQQTYEEFCNKLKEISGTKKYASTKFVEIKNTEKKNLKFIENSEYSELSDQLDLRLNIIRASIFKQIIENIYEIIFNIYKKNKELDPKFYKF